MSKVHPIERVIAAAQEAVAVDIDGMMQDGRSGIDSEIEKLFFAALYAAVTYTQGYMYDGINCFGPDRPRKDPLTWEPEDPHYEERLLIFPQTKIANYRADFVILYLDWRNSDFNTDNMSYDKRVWKRLVVECDGHNYHERTKEQAAHDRARDRYMIGLGLPVFRFTGSELWRDPVKCAEQVIDFVAGLNGKN